jgi:hypothetical protein
MSGNQLKRHCLVLDIPVDQTTLINAAGPASKTSSKTHEVTSAPIDQREPLPIERGVQPKDEKDQDRKKGSALNVGVPCALHGQLCPRTQHSATLSINTTQNHRKRSVFFESSSSYCRARPEVGLAAPFSRRGTLSARFGQAPMPPAR